MEKEEMSMDDLIEEHFKHNYYSLINILTAINSVIINSSEIESINYMKKITLKALKRFTGVFEEKGDKND